MALSLIIHQLLYIGLEYKKATLQSQLLLNKLNEVTKLVEIEIQDQPVNAKKIVTDTKTGKLAKKKSDTLFQSKDNRVVKNEQVARRTGPTQNSINTNGSKSKANKVKEKIFDKSEFGYFTKKPSNANGYSTISEYIPNVKRGGFTSLNTNQFIYYAFFNRINQQIRSRWTNHLSFLGQRLPDYRQAQLANKDHVTNIKAVLTSDGKLKKIILVKSSGYAETDLAVTEAIRKAAPFTNPPKGLVEADGLIRLDYSFHLTWQEPTQRRQGS